MFLTLQLGRFFYANRAVSRYKKGATGNSMLGSSERNRTTRWLGVVIPSVGSGPNENGLTNVGHQSTSIMVGTAWVLVGWNIFKFKKTKVSSCRYG